MESQFICPCCGYRAKLTPELCETVKSVVKNFLRNQPKVNRITYYNNGRKRSIMRIDSIAIAWSIYFIRKMTGEPYKAVASAIPLAIQTSVRYMAILERNCYTSDELFEIEAKLAVIIRRKLQLKKQEVVTV